jgi:hypothetical protein
MAPGIEAAERAYRDFKDAQGRTIRGAMVAFDVDKGIVTIELENRRSSRAPVSTFCEEDQAYIRDWKTSRDFLNDSKLRISATRKRSANKELSYATYNLEFTVRDTRYEIVLENRSQTEMNALELQYCIFYEQDMIEDNEQVCRQGICHGRRGIATLAPREQFAVLTDPVSIFQRELDYSWQYVNAADGSYSDIENVQNGSVHGIWVRLHMKMASGLTQIRDYCAPESIAKNHEWAGASLPVGINTQEPIDDPGYLPVAIRR